MTIENMYGTLSTLLRAYDAETGRGKAEAVIANPAGELDSENPVYSAAAVLLTDLRTKLDAKTTPKTVTAAVRRVIRNCNPARPELCGMFPYDGRFVVCDGYRLLRLNADITSLPHVVNDFDVASAMRGVVTSTIECKSDPNLNREWVRISRFYQGHWKNMKASLASQRLHCSAGTEILPDMAARYTGTNPSFAPNDFIKKSYHTQTYRQCSDSSFLL